MRSARRSSAFTLVELLVVIAIIGILVGLAVPAFKNFGRSNVITSASRQLLDDIGRARQLAISHRTTVYMVFVTTNFWNTTSGSFNGTWWNQLTLAQQSAVTNLCDRQVSGYNFLSYGQVGDQPGQHTWHYLSSWQSMPDGMFIALDKFNPSFSPMYITYWDQDYHNSTVASSPIPCFTNLFSLAYNTLGVNVAESVPFPLDSATNAIYNAYSANGVPDCYLPCIAFDYTGKLISEIDANGSYHDAFIPLSAGVVSPARDGATKMLQLGSPDIQEIPPGNTTNISYNVIHIDALTGRAVLEYHKIQ